MSELEIKANDTTIWVGNDILEKNFQAVDNFDGTWYVMDAECETVAEKLTERNAKLIAQALNELDTERMPEMLT